MALPLRILILFVALFHASIFAVEAFFWMSPIVHRPALGRLTTDTGIPPHDQALILKTLFVNQGFYNLFLALAGAAGLALLARGYSSAGRTLVAYMCLSALGAGIVLLFSTHAYAGAALQAVPAAAALALMWRGRTAQA